MPKVNNYAALYSLRPDGRYAGHYYDRDHKRHTVVDRDPERLWRRINELEQAAAKPPVLLFRELAAAWHAEAEKTLRPGTWACYDSLYDRALDAFGDMPAADLSTPDVQELLEQMARQGMSKKSCHNQRIVISNIYKAAMRDRRYHEQIRYNPAEAAQVPKSAAAPKTREAPEDEIIRQIRARAQEVPFGVYALFLISTGTRRGEALATRWRDIDREAKTIQITGSVNFHSSTPQIGETKTAAGVRTVPLLPDLAVALDALPAHAPDDFLFYAADPKKIMAETTYKRHWLNYCKAMGFVTTEEIPCTRYGKPATKTIYKPTLTAHIMRHGYATLLFESEVDVYTMQRLLGHADIQVTMGIYTHLRKQQEAKSIGRLADKVSLSLDKK